MSTWARHHARWGNDLTRPDLLGVVLTGGRSSRMGTDKAELVWKGRRLVDLAVETLKETGAARIILGGGAARSAGSLEILPDHTPGGGPVGGISSVLRALWPEARGKRFLVLPVDMPLLDAQTLLPLVEGIRARYYEGHPLPLSFSLTASVADAAEHALAGRGSVHEFLHAMNADVLPEPQGRRLVNVNTPDEWDRLCGLKERA